AMALSLSSSRIFFFQAEDGIRDGHVTGVQTCALPIYLSLADAGQVQQVIDQPRLQLDVSANHAQRLARVCRQRRVRLQVLHRRRSEERRVGKECRSWMSAVPGKKNVRSVTALM